MSDQLEAALADIDAANANDPNRLGNHPLAQAQGRLASIWLDRLTSSASVPVKIAARAHHLCRWELARADYPDGRAGYLQWRRDNKLHQANAAADILVNHGYTDDTINRVGELLLRKGLGSDPDTQLIEDAACLVFVETQFDEMVGRLGHDHMVGVVQKTLRKMSPDAIDLVATIELSATAKAVLSDATSSDEMAENEGTSQ